MDTVTLQKWIILFWKLFDHQKSIVLQTKAFKLVPANASFTAVLTQRSVRCCVWLRYYPPALNPAYSTPLCDAEAKTLKPHYSLVMWLPFGMPLRETGEQEEGRGLFLLPFSLLFLDITLPVAFHSAAIISCCLQLPSTLPEPHCSLRWGRRALGNGPLGSQSSKSKRPLLKAPEYEQGLGSAPPWDLGPTFMWPSPNFQGWQF